MNNVYDVLLSQGRLGRLFPVVGYVIIFQKTYSEGIDVMLYRARAARPRAAIPANVLAPTEAAALLVAAGAAALKMDA